ncbi:hypothetical protein [Suicoccus acidiformans]|uniref:hypothetical protein n=1 Tax=Suicoccus acidiformans TaxID=2036206 RepID=UPI0013C2BD03|nr:hypothetical protein [Suicoccus acidiformans]
MKVTVRPWGSYKNIDYDEIWIKNQETVISFSNLVARVNRWQVTDAYSRDEPIIWVFRR